MISRILSSLITLIFLTWASMANAGTDQSVYHQAEKLYTVLQQYPDQLSTDWIKSTRQLLKEDDNDFALINAVCMGNPECLNGAASFPVAAIGLKNTLKLIKPHVKECQNKPNPFICVQERAGAIVLGMVTGDVAQLKFQLKNYLESGQ